MHDDFLSQTWAERHGELSTLIDKLIGQTRVAFERLVARAYDAPWKQEERSDVVAPSLSRKPERHSEPQTATTTPRDAQLATINLP